MNAWIEAALDSWIGSSRWMGWNLFLAILPLGLSVWLFRRNQARSLFWWIVCLTFVAFLPNAPYVLTDLIHLSREIRYNSSPWFNTVVVLPKYALFVLIGFQAYVISLINAGSYLRQNHLSRYILPMEMMLHVLSAIGVYLGRFERLNSWYFVTRLHVVLDSVTDTLLEQRPLVIIALTFVVIAVLYWLFKEITLALLRRWQASHPSLEP
ncbi:MAG TPA: DUF1361 domain-containing protein [Leptolyngbyaceae cyanobacterium M33_DOE_097]|uniref:DUF1361 domain-containing protein n=1 Tax=Oscillatoriales cyanobacterium SpSt-418 TaxID=2282169 RepID=A0A7C3KBZ6_9CYAN|nr:DUF1361 domain-containing protein [Leptolyngbyaceae cyanobacterium M33_DOE_097]